MTKPLTSASSHKPLMNEYALFLKEIKDRIRSAQYEALKLANKEMITLYWDLGKMIVDRQKKHRWGDSIVKNLAKDLQIEFPGVVGYSVDNLWRMRKFYINFRDKAKLAPLVQEISRTIVEYALRESKKPIGVAKYQIVSRLPRNLQKELPAPEQIAKLIDEIG